MQSRRMKKLDPQPLKQTNGGPKDHINKRILQIMVSGIPLILGLRARMEAPYVYVGFWAPSSPCSDLLRVPTPMMALDIFEILGQPNWIPKRMGILSA